MTRLLGVGMVTGLLLATGCASNHTGGADATITNARLPYVVEIVGMPGTKSPQLPSDWTDCPNLRRLLDAQELAACLVERLKEKGVFTAVRLASPPGSSAAVAATAVPPAQTLDSLKPDITLRVTFSCGRQTQGLDLGEGTPYGEGTNRFWPCTLSTGMWLFLGPVCWWIGDREYKQEDDAPPQCIYVCEPHWQQERISDSLSPVVGYLSFLERHDWRIAWLWNIILPPWAGPLVFGTNQEITNESLATRALEQISDGLPGAVVTRIDTERVKTGKSYFLSERAGGTGLMGYVASKVRPDEIRLDSDSLKVEFLGGEAKLAVLRRIQEEIAGGASPGVAAPSVPYDFVFKIPSPEDARRFVKIRVFSGDPEKPVGSWTVAR